jgi:hypothetical protein
MRFLKAAVITASISTQLFAAAESIEFDSPSSPFSLPVKLHATEHFLFSNTTDFVDPTLPRTSLLMNEGRVRAEYQQFSFGIHYSNRFTPDGNPLPNRPFVLEKKALTFENKNWTLVLGDSHQELGRGIALSLFRDDVFGLANTVEGASARFTSSSGATEVGGFAGRLRSLQAPVALIPWQNPLEDREVWMASTSGKARVAEDSYIGGHYLLTLARPLQSTQFDKRWHTTGGSVSSEGILPDVDVYAESNVLSSQNAVDGSNLRPQGYGTFASVTYSPLPWKFQVDGKDYRGYYFDFQRPPSLEEDIVQSLNNQDMSIGRLTVSRNGIASSFSVGQDRVAKAPMRHFVLRGVANGPARTVWVARAGYRWLAGENSISHANLSVKIPTFAGQTLELGYRKLLSNLNLSFFPTTDDRNYFDVSYSFSDDWSMNFGYEYLPTNSDENGQHYFNGGTRVAFSSDLQARAFIGKTSGGPQCSGGICRTVPPYTGGMLDVSYVF